MRLYDYTIFKVLKDKKVKSLYVYKTIDFKEIHKHIKW